MADREYHPAYRPDIDGLRAIAVLSVVIFHLFQGILPSGFLGVDVFYVISGYLITTILVRECEAGTYSIAKFYDRRVRRIMPALLFMMASVTVVTLLIFLSADLIGFAKSALATFAFVSNIYFWRDTDYFSAAASTKPLLHTWSLGIEEQFYILFPLILYALIKIGRLRLVAPALLALSAASFAAAVAMIYVNKAAIGFYLLPMRAWELGVGALLATAGIAPPARPEIRTVTAAAGGVLLIAGLCGAMPVLPGLAYLPAPTWVCAGTALLIWSGRGEKNAISRALAAKPLVAIGLISYSLYLWHWPVYVAAHYFLIRPPAWFESLLLVVLSVFAAIVSWRFVERPFRGQRMPSGKVLMITGLCTATLAAFFVAILYFDGFPGRFDPRSGAYNRVAGTHYRCAVSSYLSFGQNYACPVNLPDRDLNSADVVLLGNSHAQMYVPAVEPELARRGLHGLLVPANGCLPTATVNISPDCLRISSANLERVAALPRAKLVILAFSWDMIHSPMFDRQNRPIGKVSWQRLLGALTDTIGSLQRAGKKVIVVGPVPYPGYDVASVVSREIAFGRPPSPLSQTRVEFDAMFGAGNQWVATNPAGSIGVLPSRLFCGPAACSYLLNGVPVFADDNHLSSYAMPAFRPMFSEALDRAGAR